MTTVKDLGLATVLTGLQAKQCTKEERLIYPIGPRQSMAETLRSRQALEAAQFLELDLLLKSRRRMVRQCGRPTLKMGNFFALYGTDIVSSLMTSSIDGLNSSSQASEMGSTFTVLA